MIGIILAAGAGTRLYPITKIINKNLLPLFDKPSIYYSISIMLKLSIKKIIIVCNGSQEKAYYQLLKNGEHLGIRILYVNQERPLGIVDAVLKCKKYANNKKVLLLLGDNFFYGQCFIDTVQKAIKSNKGATMFVLRRDYEQIITTIKFDSNNEIVDLKREFAPKNKWISPGIFIYDSRLFDYIDGLSGINSEWVEVNQKYLMDNNLDVIKFKNGLFWFDVGLASMRLEAENLISLIQKSEGRYVGCIEEIAYHKEMIDKHQLEMLMLEMDVCEYKRYLTKVLDDNNI